MTSRKVLLAEARTKRIRVERELMQRSFHRFLREAWHLVETKPLVDGWNVQRMCKALERATAGDIRNLMLNQPPGSSKSIIVCVFWSAWNIVKDPTASQLYVSFDLGLVLRDAGKTKTILESDWFRERWPHIRINPSSALSAISILSADGTHEISVRMGASIRGKITGKHPKFFVIDDPIKPVEATPERLEAINATWPNTIASRGDQREVCNVLIMQRIAENDLCGHLLATEPSLWALIRTPMLFDPDLATGGDPRTEAGECYDPIRYPPEVVAKIQLRLREDFDAQYQQDPTPKKGVIFAKARWVTYAAKDLPRGGITFLTCDANFKGAEDSDFVSLQIVRYKAPTFYVMDVVSHRYTFLETLGAMRELVRTYKLAAILVERAANGYSIINTLEQNLPNVIGIDTHGDSKSTRGKATTAVFEAGNVRYLEGAPWAPQWLRQIKAFPKGANDDDADAIIQGILWILNDDSLQPADYGAANEGMRKLLGSI